MRRMRSRRRIKKAIDYWIGSQSAQIPWEVLLLIGGGIALANAFIATGLDDLVAEQLIFLEGMNHIIAILIIVAMTAVVGRS